MTVLLSDMHLGRDPAGDPARLADLLDCVSELCTSNPSARPALEAVVFLGDTFDAFVDAPGHVHPSLGAWAQVVDDIRGMGAAVRYFSGNHDRWHMGTIRAITGKEPSRGPHLEMLHGFRCLLTHGDEYDALPAAERLIKRISHTRWAYAAYRTALPFGGAQWLAQSVSSRLASFDPQARTVGALRATAERMLARDDADVVIFGHAHQAECRRVENGWYVNTGDWHRTRSYAVLGPGGPEVRQWI